MKKLKIVLLALLLILVGCSSKDEKVESSFSKTSQDIWGEIIINDTDKITVPTTLKELGDDYSYVGYPVSVEGYKLITTSIQKEGHQRILVSVVEDDEEEIDEDSTIGRFAFYSNQGSSVSVCGIKIGDERDKIYSALGEPDKVIEKKANEGEILYYYGGRYTDRQYILFNITDKKVKTLEVSYLPDEYLKEEGK